MAHTLNIVCPLIFFFSLAVVAALPTSIVEEVKSDDMNNKKVKRAQSPISSPEESQKNAGGYFSPTAIKRGINTDQLPLLTEWDQQRYRQADVVPASLYTPEEDLDDKTLSEYVKGYRYGTNRDQLDEALQNAILKSEMYGDPAAVNQYRYYGNDDKKRRRRNTNKLELQNRFKRQTELSPEEILAILTLWENERERQHIPKTYRPWQQQQQLQRLDDIPSMNEREDSDDERNDEDWMDAPVYPHITEHISQISPNYYYDAKPQVFEKRPRWGGFSENKNKRFMVAKKRNDPTRELRYLNGPSHDDYYTLSELLGTQREPNLPLYQRYVL